MVWLHLVRAVHGEEDKSLQLKLFAFSNLSITGYNSLGYWNFNQDSQMLW